MLISYWSAKGGAGATVLSAAHALSTDGPVLVVDLDGDLPAALGVASEVGDAPGVADWLAAGSAVPSDALDRLCLPIADDLLLLPRGRGPLVDDRVRVLARLLADAPRTVVVDAGTRPGPAGVAVIHEADRSILVTRACYLAIRRALAIDLAPTEVTLVREPQRALRTDDVARALGVPVRATVTVDPAVARAVDAGLLASRLPRPLRRVGQRLTVAA